MALTITQSIEYFHLAFLAVLRTQVDEVATCLRANLRYFFTAPATPNIDMARATFDRWTERSPRTPLSAPPHRVTYEGDMSCPATDYTRRWKVHFTSRDHEEKIRTKIEFSSRNGDTRFDLEIVPDEIVHPTRCDRPRCSTTT